MIPWYLFRVWEQQRVEAYRRLVASRPLAHGMWR
jgi:hypothetical protein